jgi:putative transposase
MGLTEYFAFYNAERSHQSLGYRTPNEVYRTAVGDGARIVNKFSGEDASSKAVAVIKWGRGE